MNVRVCNYCQGAGCEECDRTGIRYREHIDAGDGITASVSGSGDGLSPEAADALAGVARTAVARMEGGATQGRRRPDGTSLGRYEPGDYGRKGGVWQVCLPTGVRGRLDDRWQVEEHGDGTVSIGADDGPTVTVSPSIWDSPQGWHGFLRHGVWWPVDGSVLDAREKAQRG